MRQTFNARYLVNQPPGTTVMTIASVTCSQCCMALPADTPRSPCPRCGSTLRTILELVEERLKAYTGHMLKIRSPRAGKRRYRLEEKSLYEWSFDLKRLVHRSVTIDRLADRYAEHIVDPLTGDVIRSCDEPLHLHVGHGTARRRPQQK
ncbi:hypothetical protein ACVWWJ_002675 [Luteibacter sp. HA06]